MRRWRMRWIWVCSSRGVCGLSAEEQKQILRDTYPIVRLSGRWGPKRVSLRMTRSGTNEDDPSGTNEVDGIGTNEDHSIGNE